MFTEPLKIQFLTDYIIYQKFSLTIHSRVVSRLVWSDFQYFIIKTDLSAIVCHIKVNMTTNLIQSAFLHILFSKRQRISTKFCMYKINTKVQIMHINTISLKKFPAFQNCPYCLFLRYLSFITTRVPFKIHKNLEVFERIQIYFCFQYQLFLRVKDNSKNFKNKKT